jgi:hypothetical protein
MSRAPTTQKEVLEKIIHETHLMAPPTLGRVRELMGGKNVRASVQTLIVKGKLARPYDDGPLIPRETWEGEPLKVALLRAQDADRLESERIMREGAAAFERLAADPAAWAEYQAETKLFEKTLMDGLHEEPPYDDERVSEGREP